MAKIQGIGVDIDGNLLKVVSATLSGSKLSVEQAHVHRIKSASPAESFGSGRKSYGGGKNNTRNPVRSNQDPFWQEVSDAVEDIANQMDIKKKYVATSVSQMGIVNREVSFPSSMTDSEVAKTLPSKLKSLLPESLNDMFYDYDISKESDGSKVVNLVAASKAAFEPKISSLQFAGLEPIVLEIDGRMSYQHYKSTVKASSVENATTLFIDLRTTAANMFIFHNDEMVFFKEIDLVMSSGMVGRIYESVKSENTDALREAQTKDDEFNDLLNDYTDSLVSNIETELRLYQALHNGSKPDSMIVYGSGSILPGLSELFTDRLDVIGVTTNILQYVTVGRMLKKAEFIKAGGFYTAAVQLARRACQGAQLV